MSIKGQQLRLHYEDFTTYIITLNWTPQHHRNVNQGTATASTLRGFHHLYNNFKLDTTTTGMSIKGQQLRLHYKDFTTYIITLNWTPQHHRNVNQGTATPSTLRGFHHLYNNFKLDTTTTGMSIKGQQLRLHYEDFTTYIITLNWTPQHHRNVNQGTATASTLRGFHHLYNNFKLDTTTPQECQSRDSNCVYTTRISPPI